MVRSSGLLEVGISDVLKRKCVEGTRSFSYSAVTRLENLVHVVQEGEKPAHARRSKRNPVAPNNSLSVELLHSLDGFHSLPVARLYKIQKIQNHVPTGQHLPRSIPGLVVKLHRQWQHQGARIA